MQHSNQLLIQLQTDLLGLGSVKFTEYYDDYDCGEWNSCDFYFKNLIIYDKKGVVLTIGKTSSTTNKKLVDLQKVKKLKGYFTFDLKTNTTVYMSLEVLDNDGDLNRNDEVRTLSDLTIPFHEIKTNTGWTDKKFNISSDPYSYLDIQFRLERCYEHFEGSGCNFCLGNYYTSSCDKYCIPELGNYTCNSSGNKMCAAHKTGQNCDKCQKEWSGDKCEECAENYFPEKVCNVTCIAVEGRYTCSHLGGKVCHENRTGVDCDSCTEHRTGEMCENCTEGWGGDECQECAKDYYPKELCNVSCTEVQSKYTCSDLGGKVCHENWTGVDCDSCTEHRTGEMCENCTEGWGGDKCQECAKDYYPKELCNVSCTEVQSKYTCSDLGGKVCHENWTGVDCDSCTEHRTGEMCENCTEGWGGDKCQECAKDYYPEVLCNVSCMGVQRKFICTNDGRKACIKNWKGEECDVCSEKYFGELCEAFCEETERYNCSSSGEMVCLDNTTTVENNCGKFSKLSKKPTYKLIIGVVIGTILLVVILSVVIVLMRKKGKNSDATQLLDASDLKDAKSEKITETRKGAQSSTITITTLEMTYATLNHNSSDGKSKENEGHFEHATYATLNREHAIKDNCEQSNYNHLIKPTHQTHLKKGKENINQGDRRTEDIRKEDTYADISIVSESCGPSVDKLEKEVKEMERNDKIDTTYSSLNHYHNPAAEDEEDSYSHLSKFKSSDRDCCKNDLDEEETYADITILGQKEEVATDEAVDDNDAEGMYAAVSFVGERKEIGILEDNEAFTRIKDKEDSSVYLAMGDIR